MTDPAVAAFDAAAEKFAAAHEAVKTVIYGQDRVVEETLIALLAGGHALLVGAPGLGKTLLVSTVAETMGLASKRVQFTPDLMPGDITGTEVLEESDTGARAFRFIKGPVFCQLLMADEINRASPRTQSALLQAMQERHVTVAGERHDLPAPFHVLATQNPLEQEGTYPLPEAQLDRFLLQSAIDYPDEAAERKMLIETTGATLPEAKRVMGPEDLIAGQAQVRDMPMGESIMDAILALTRSARPGDEATDFIREAVVWGPGPRASQALMLACRARALLQGRYAPSLEDVAALAAPVLRHRMALSFAARADGAVVDDVIDGLVQKTL